MTPTPNDATRSAPADDGRIVTPNFITDIIDRDLADGTVTRIVTRFPPEPNGYMHIGHAKAVCLSFGVAADYGGITYLRFDDTNPTTENEEYVRAIIANIDWLGFRYEEVRHASDYFPRLYQYALELIDRGLAYVDGSSEEEIRRLRGTVTEAGSASPDRSRTPAENRALFERMRAGEFPQGSYVLRAKIDMAAANMKMRDPILYRIVDAPHYRTGTEWPIYPMYDFAHPLSDAIEHVTHSLCTLEFESNRDVYDWLLDHLIEGPRPHQYEFARLKLDYTVVAKRKLRRLVEDRHVRGWDDPRMPTLVGMRRRGVTPEAILDLTNRVGVAKADSRTPPALVDHSIRYDLNTRAPRVLAVLDPLEVEITNLPPDAVTWLDADYWPHDVPRSGSRRLPLTRDIVIERDDFEREPSSGFKRLAPGRAVRLRHGAVIRCDEVVTDSSDAVVRLRCSAFLEELGSAPDDVKVWATVHWVSRSHGVPLTSRLYRPLFTVANPDAVEGDFTAYLDPASEVTVEGLIEPSVVDDDPATRYQFERLGYFWRDPVDSTPDALVFNRIVALKDGYAKTAARGAGATRTSSRRAAPRRDPTAEAEAAAAAVAAEEPRLPHPSVGAMTLASEFGISVADAQVMAPVAGLVELFRGTVAAGSGPDQAAAWVVNEIAPVVRSSGSSDAPLTPAVLAKVIDMVETGVVTQRVAKELLVDVLRTGADPAALAAARGLERVDDEDAIRDMVLRVLAENPAEVAAYRGGKTRLRGFFVGQVMRVSRGRAEPLVIHELLDAELGDPAQSATDEPAT